tara:strand:- start:14561 stop:14791 length:231 start_codon:yes stop_codon:yes gene_type:complete
MEQNNNMTIQQAKDFLRARGYCISNLWHIDDVKNNYVCTDKEAYRILDLALNNEWLVEKTYEAISGEAGELEEIED